MTQEEILKYNKLCAEFLNLHRDEEVAIYEMTAYTYDLLKFHSDWNWIHEVKQNIIGIGYCWFQFNDIIHINENSAISSKKLIKISFNKLKEKEAVVQAINQFLIWYNETN